MPPFAVGRGGAAGVIALLVVSAAAFGVCMVGNVAFSHMPWWEGAAFDGVKDLPHSVTATAVGFAFVFGVLLRLAQRCFGGAPAGGVGARGRWGVVLDVVAAASAGLQPKGRGARGSSSPA